MASTEEGTQPTVISSTEFGKWPQWLKMDAARVAAVPTLGMVVSAGVAPALAFRLMYSGAMGWMTEKVGGWGKGLMAGVMGLNAATLIGLHPSIAESFLGIQHFAMEVTIAVAAFKIAGSAVKSRALPRGLVHEDVSSSLKVKTEGVVAPGSYSSGADDVSQEANPVRSFLTELEKETRVDGESSENARLWGPFEITFDFQGSRQVTEISPKTISSGQHESSVSASASFNVQDTSDGSIRSVDVHMPRVYLPDEGIMSELKSELDAAPRRGSLATSPALQAVTENLLLPLAERSGRSEKPVSLAAQPLVHDAVDRVLARGSSFAHTVKVKRKRGGVGSYYRIVL